MPRAVPAALLALLLLGAGSLPLARGAEDEGIVRVLEEAKHAEMTAGDPTRARRLYESLLLPDRIRRLSNAQRGDALAGRARCAKAEGHLELAEQCWTMILADAALDAGVRAYAQRERDAWLVATTPSTDDLARALREEQRTEARRRAETRFQQARLALDRNAYDEAMALVLEARALDPQNERIRALATEIQAARPDPGRLLTQMLEFIRTRALAERVTVRHKVDELLQAGRAAQARGDLGEAARLLDDAVRRIDGSGFLEIGVARGFASLLERRAQLVTLLEQVQAQARTAGLTDLPPIPELPPPEARTPGLEGQLYGLLAQLFRAGEDGAEELRFHTFASRHGARARRRPALTSQIPDMAVRQEASELSRASWAQHWIAREMGGLWLDPLALDFDEQEARLERRGQPARLLARFGDVLAVQHKEALHRRVEALASAFELTPPPMRMDVMLFAATTAGVVRVAEALQLRAQPGAEGFSLIHRDELVETSAALVGGLEGIAPLGQVRLVFDDASSTTLFLEHRTADHPMFEGLPPPALSVPADLASYGLVLDLFAEDMPHAASGLPRSAVSVVARTRMPTHTTNVPRLASGPDRFQRIPRMGEHSVEADVELPHFGSLVLLGLPNPFPESNQEFHELVLLIAARRNDDPLPDTPAPGTDPRVVPAGWLHEEHALGPLGLSVEDQILREGWPELASADPLDLWDAREARDRYLGRLLARMARLVPEDAVFPAQSPVVVHDGAAVATLEPNEQLRLARAVARLRSHEDDLYRVHVESAVVPAEEASAWATWPDVVRAPAGALRLPAEAAARVRAALAAAGEPGGLERIADSTLARPTQQVALRHLEERSVVRDVETREEDGRRRRVPLLDRVAQGLVVEVRPGVEDEQGLRDVFVRVRTARWAGIEHRPLPGAADAAADAGVFVDVVRWIREPQGAAADRADTDVLGDASALLLTVPRPGAEGQVVAVWVQVVRVP